VNDAGNLLLMTFLENDRETIYRWNRTEGFRLLASTAEVGALGFVGASDAVYTDSGTNEVIMRRCEERSVTQFLSGASDGVSGPIGVGTSSRVDSLSPILLQERSSHLTQITVFLKPNNAPATYPACTRSVREFSASPID
jgi:hypothetical protein